MKTKRTNSTGNKYRNCTEIDFNS